MARVSVPPRILGILVMGLLLAGPLAGCAGQEGKGNPPAAQPATATFGVDTGAIEGSVTDEELTPLAGARVGVRAKEAPVDEFLGEAKTDGDGRYAFSDLAPGKYVLMFQLLGYEDAARMVTVNAGLSTQVPEVRLVRIPVAAPFSVVQAQRGLLGCGFDVRPVVAVAACGVVGIVGDAIGVNTSSVDRFLIEWTFTGVPTAQWSSNVLEMQWTTNQALGRGLRVIWETLDGVDFDDVAGPSPLRTYADEKKVRAVLKEAPMCDEANCTFRSRVFPTSETLGSNSPVDVGVIWQQSFEQFVSAFFYEAAPEDYTALDG